MSQFDQGNQKVKVQVNEGLSSHQRDEQLTELDYARALIERGDVTQGLRHLAELRELIVKASPRQ